MKALKNINIKKRHLKILLLMTLVDLIATMIWYEGWGIPEGNPIMAIFIDKSLIYFAITKILISTVGVFVLSKYLKLRVSQVGAAVLLACYAQVTLIHSVIFLSLV